jgi:acyl-CoA thioester hydrolase
MLPVVDMKFKFLKTTHYDALLTVKTTLKPSKVSVYGLPTNIYNEQNELINEAETELAFVKRDNWKPCVAPDFVLKAIEEHETKQKAS